MDCTLSVYDTLVDWLIDRIAGYLSTSPAAVETDKTFGDYGLDSAFALNLCTELETELGVLVEPTIVWDYPTIHGVAGHLAERSGRM